VRAAIHSTKWCSVFFADSHCFDNMNTLETLHGRD
jgi:hypothetical protein